LSHNHDLKHFRRGEVLFLTDKSKDLPSKLNVYAKIP
jgi:hypothetical protein